MSADDTDGKVVPLKPKPKRAPKRRTGNKTWFGETETANAARFAEAHKGRAAWALDQLGWLVWQRAEGRWTPDDGHERIRLAKRIARQLASEAATKDDSDLWKFAKASASRRGLEAMIWAAEPELRIEPDRLDADRWSFVAGNGTIDLRTGELRESKPEDWNTKRSPVAYDPTATAPVWEAFLARVVPDPNVRAFIRRSVGYSLTGEVSEQHFWFLFGSGANGKTTFLETIRHILGDYAHQAAFETFLEGKMTPKGSASPELAALRGARFLSATEAPEGRRLAEPVIKALTGGDTIAARHLYREVMTFRPCSKLWLSGNHKPRIKGTDEGMWRRVLLVPFEEFIPKGERDPDLFRKLACEAPGILAWAVAGCLEWQRTGLKPPEAVGDATEGYRAEEDAFRSWLRDAVAPNPEAGESASDLWASWIRYAREDGSEAHDQRWFKRRLEEAGFKQKRTARGMVWQGIALLQLGLPGLS